MNPERWVTTLSEHNWKAHRPKERKWRCDWGWGRMRDNPSVLRLKHRTHVHNWKLLWIPKTPISKIHHTCIYGHDVISSVITNPGRTWNLQTAGFINQTVFMAAATCFHSLTSQGNYLSCQFLKGIPEDKAGNRAGFKRNGGGGGMF